MEKGLMSQLTNRVTPMPRTCWRTSCRAPKSTLTSMGMIITQMSSPTGRADLGHLQSTDGLEQARQQLAQRDTGQDAQEDPEGQVTFKEADGFTGRHTDFP